MISPDLPAPLRAALEQMAHGLSRNDAAVRAASISRTYRDGGGDLGTRLAVDWVREAADRLAPGGRIVLYTGAPVVDGQDRVRAALSQLADQRGFTLRYDEIDPDVFGGTLRQPAYRTVDRIAAVGAVLTAS